MSHVFTPEAVVLGLDDDIALLGPWPSYATIMTDGRTPATDLRSPDRIRQPGQGHRPDKILARLHSQAWHRRNTGLAQVEGGIVFDGGVLTSGGRPVLGVSQNHWEKKHAAPEAGRLTDVRPARRFPGPVAVLPFCMSGRYANYFHFFTEFLALAPACVSLVERHGIDRIVVTIDRPRAGSFQDALLRQFFGARFHGLVFEPAPFTAETVAFGSDRRGIYRRDPETGTVAWRMEEGLGTTFMSEGLGKVFDTLRAGRAAAGPEGPPVLLVSRERARVRRIVNEAALREALAPLGAEKVNLEDHPLPRQIAMVASAQSLVGCHGAGMINAGFLARGRRAIELTSRQYLPRAVDFGGLSGLRDIAYHIMLCDEEGDFRKDNRLVANTGDDIVLSAAAIDRVVQVCRDGLDRAAAGQDPALPGTG